MEVTEVIETLKMENELILFNPSTGDILTLNNINDLNKECYLAHEKAIELLNKEIPKTAVSKETPFYEGVRPTYLYCPVCDFNLGYISALRYPNYCPNCGSKLAYTYSTYRSEVN